jgi:hypothetical protein
MPTDQIEQELEAEIAALDKAAAARPRPAAKVAPADLVTLPPELIQALSMMLVDIGLLAAPTQTLTPEFRQALQTIADQSAPGLYDLNNDKDLEEVVTGVMNGTIQPAPTAVAPSASRADAGGIKSVGGAAPGGSGAVTAPNGGTSSPGY